MSEGLASMGDLSICLGMLQGQLSGVLGRVNAKSFSPWISFESNMGTTGFPNAWTAPFGELDLRVQPEATMESLGAIWAATHYHHLDDNVMGGGPEYLEVGRHAHDIFFDTESLLEDVC